MILQRIWIILAAAAVWANEGLNVTLSRVPTPNGSGGVDIAPLMLEGNAQTSVGPHVFQARVNAYRSGESGDTFRDRWSCELNHDYRLFPRVSLSYLVGYKEDRLGGYDYQTYARPGMGVRMLDAAEHKIDLQANIFYVRDKPEKLPENDYLSSRFGGVYRWQIEENLRFVQEATYRVNLEETQSNFFCTKSAVETRIAPSLSMGLSYKFDYVSAPPSLPQRTDQTVQASLKFDY